MINKKKWIIKINKRIPLQQIRSFTNGRHHIGESPNFTIIEVRDIEKDLIDLTETFRTWTIAIEALNDKTVVYVY